GMKASAEIFARLMTFLARVLPTVGTIFSTVAKVLTSDWSPGHLWNILFASAKAFFSAVVSSARAFGRAVAASFDALRHDIATIWDTIWRNTIGRVQTGIATVNRLFNGLPGQILGALRGLGHSLGSFASAAMNEMWNGFKTVAGNILGWLGGFVSSIINKVKSLLHIGSPSAVFHDIGMNMMLGLERGIKAGAHRAADAAKSAATTARQAANVGPGVQRWAPLVRQALAMEGLSPTLLRNVLYQMMTESGGNPNAINNTDINARNGQNSRGLMQVIPATFASYHWPGTSGNIYNPLANIAAALNYARHVYGPSLMSGGMGIGSGHGYALGGIISEPIWGVGRSGRRYTFGERGPETVTPGAGGDGSMARVEALLRQLIAATNAAPSRSGAAFARELNGSSARAVR